MDNPFQIRHLDRDQALIRPKLDRVGFGWVPQRTGIDLLSVPAAALRASNTRSRELIETNSKPMTAGKNQQSDF